MLACACMTKECKSSCAVELLNLQVFITILLPVLHLNFSSTGVTWTSSTLMGAREGAPSQMQSVLCLQFSIIINRTGTGKYDQHFPGSEYKGLYFSR